ncbi:MAG: hypothetical protein WAU07_03130 [Microgenomates group bacterium]
MQDIAETQSIPTEESLKLKTEVTKPDPVNEVVIGGEYSPRALNIFDKMTSLAVKLSKSEQLSPEERQELFADIDVFVTEASNAFSDAPEDRDLLSLKEAVAKMKEQLQVARTIAQRKNVEKTPPATPPTTIGAGKWGRAPAILRSLFV